MTYTITVGEGMQLIIAPTFHGFHPIWASAQYQVDICNNVDDVIIRSGESGTLYRVPITAGFLPELGRLVADMNNYDVQTFSPWAGRNHRVRSELLYAATRRVQGSKPQSLNMFEPGCVAPALTGPVNAAYLMSEIEKVIAALVESSGDTRIPGQ